MLSGLKLCCTCTSCTRSNTQNEAPLHNTNSPVPWPELVTTLAGMPTSGWKGVPVLLSGELGVVWLLSVPVSLSHLPTLAEPHRAPSSRHTLPEFASICTALLCLSSRETRLAECRPLKIAPVLINIGLTDIHSAKRHTRSISLFFSLYHSL